MAKSASHPPPQLLEWFRRRAIELTPEGRIGRLELWHAIDGEAGIRLTVVEMEERPEDEDPDDLAQELWAAAVEDACTRPQGSMQRYVVQAFRAGEPTAEETQAFVIQGRAITHMLGGSTEPPTERGNLSMNMRHTNDLHALVMNYSHTLAGSVGSQLEKEREANDRLRHQNEALLDKQAARDREDRAEERSQARLDALLGVVQTLAPVLISKLLTPPAAAAAQLGAATGLTPAQMSGAHHPQPQQSQPVDPAMAATIERSRRISELLSSLDSDQVQSVMGALRPEQSTAVVQILVAQPSQDQSEPQAAAAVDRAVQSLLATLDADQVRSLLEVFGPEQSQALVEIYQSVREQQQQQQQQQRSAPESATVHN